MRHGHRFIVLLGVVALLGCDGSASATNTATEDVPPTSRVATATHVGRDHSPFLAGNPWPLGSTPCVGSVLSLRRVAADGSFEGTVRFHNGCKAPVAVLCTPVEVRRRMQRGDFFRWEGMGSPYARLYIYRRDLGPTKFVGDAGAEVRGTPGDVVIAPGATIEVPIAGGIGELPPGDYGAFFHTWAVPAGSAVTTGRAVIDLRRTVAVQSAGAPGTPVVPRPTNGHAVQTGDVMFTITSP